MGQFVQHMSGWELVIAIADVAVVSYVIYRTLLLIKGTRAVQMLMGILLLILLFFLSKDEYLDLPTLNWMLDKFIASFIIIVVIIFQEDIRRALTQVGKSPIVSGGVAEEGIDVLEELVRGIAQLAAHKIGAIVAVERSADLTPYTEEGVSIDARMSKDMLMSVFLNSSQNTLHDGAVVVQKGRLAYAGCFLPLTVNPKVDRELGTRHRAAIGLSEETDACVIVISEETGAISIAAYGELTRNYTADALIQELQALFTQESRSTVWRRLGLAREEENG